jgi:hypothetical protein
LDFKNLTKPRILRHPISKGKAYEGKNCHYWEKRGYLSRFSIILRDKIVILCLMGKQNMDCIQVLVFTQWVKEMLLNDRMLKF